MKKIFTKEYWKSSISHFYNVKSICLMAIFVALMTVIGGICSIFPLKVYGRTISLLFLFWPLIGILFGPISGMSIALIVDVLMYFLFPTGYPFYIGYTLAEMLIVFVSGIIFYKSNISIIKLIIFEGFVDIVVHVGIESLFMNDIMKWHLGEAYQAYVIGGLTKNVILWPIEVVILFLLISALLPVFKSLKLVDEDIKKTITFINKKDNKEEIVEKDNL